MSERALALANKRILVTRSRNSASALAQKIEAAGGIAMCVPTIEIVPVQPTSVEATVEFWERCAWVVFSSANAVQCFVAAFGSRLDFQRVPAAVVGTATRAAAEAAGFRVEICPARFVAEELAEELEKNVVEGDQILFPHARVLRPVLASRLRARGAEVLEVVVYEARQDPQAAAALEEARGHKLDAVTFASSQTFEHFLNVAGSYGEKILRDIPIVSIGPITTAAIVERGFVVAAEAKESSLDSLVAAAATVCDLS